jgi:hypothetical protein
VADFSPQGPDLNPGPFHVRFATGKLVRTGFSPGLSVSFTECCSLFILILLLLEGRASVAWEPSPECSFGCRRALDRKVLSHECQSSKVKLCHDLFHRNFLFLLLLVTVTFVFSSVNILFLESMAVQRNEGLKKNL